MIKLVGYFEQIKKHNKLNRIHLLLFSFGILLFLGLAISLPLINSNLNKNQNIAKSEAAGNAWYVDNAVTTSGNGTSWSSAWKNFSNINWASINPGDTIYISGGSSSKSYFETLTIGKSGTTGNPITITNGVDAGHNGNVIIDGQNTRFYGVNIGYNTTAQNYVVVKNLTAQNFADGAGMHARNSADGVIFENNNIFTGSGNNSSPSRGIDIRNSSNLIVRNNTITTPPSTQAQTDGIWSSSNNGVTFDHNSIVISNQDNTGHSDCIQSFQDTNITLNGNWCWQTNSADNNHGFWISDTVTGGTIDVFNNIIYMQTNDTYAFSHWNSSYPTYNGRARFYNNTIYGGNPGIQFRDSPNSEAKNNIVVVSDSSNWGAFYLSGNLPAGPAIDNNLLWSINGAPIAQINNVVHSWAQWQALGYDTHGVNADPKFTNISAQDFTLQSTSPAIDTGVTLNLVSNDKDGITRPQGSAWDIGAYEYLTSSSPTSTPALSPTQTITPAPTLTPIYGGTASASSVYNNNSQPQYAFDQSITNQLGWGNNNAMPSWLEYNYPTAKVINRYRIYNAGDQMDGWGSENYNPKSWVFQGSNGSSWVTLHTVTDGAITMNQWKTFDFANTTSYTKYRIYINSSESGNWTRITELEFYSNTANPDPTETPTSIPTSAPTPTNTPSPTPINSSTPTPTVTTVTTIFSDNFESSLNWTLSGDTTWYTGSPKIGTHSVRLRRTGSITKTISLAGYQNVSVSFKMGAYSLDNNSENLQMLYYNGSSWVVLAQINNGSVNENNQLNPYTFALPSTVNGKSNFQIRFKLNSSATNDYGYVDDVVVTGTRI